MTLAPANGAGTFPPSLPLGTGNGDDGEPSAFPDDAMHSYYGESLEL